MKAVLIVWLAFFFHPIAMTKCIKHVLRNHGENGSYRIVMVNFRFGIECFECGEIFCNE